MYVYIQNEVTTLASKGRENTSAIFAFLPGSNVHVCTCFSIVFGERKAHSGKC